jgi:catechol-2,3-dioxygenase
MSRLGLRFSHIGLYATDLARMEAFYTQVLEFTVTDRGHLDTPRGPVELVFLSRDPDEHHQIVFVSGRPATLDFNIVNQVSLRADTLGDLRELQRRLQAVGMVELRAITHGNALSIYVADPEGNKLELFFDLPWYVSQPLVAQVDLTQSDERLMQDLEAHARQQPGFRPREQWRRDMARRMGLADGPEPARGS